MKKLFLILLLLSISCQKDSSDSKDKTSPTSETVVQPVTPPVVVAPPVVTPSPPVIPSPTLTWTEEFMDLINDHRRSIGLRALIHDDGLGEIATEHSKNMASGTTAFGHTGFSARCSAGKTVLGGGNWCGENVAMGQKTPKDAFNSWMNSPGHKANIEQGRATHTGFGYAKSSSGKYYWTQIFLEL